MTRKVTSSETSKLKRELAALKRDLKAEVKSAREAATRAKKHAAQVSEARADIAQIIERLLSEQEELGAKVASMDARWTDRVQDVVETVLANLANGSDRRGPGGSGSGTRSSPLGRVADEGVQGIRLPGSFESGNR